MEQSSMKYTISGNLVLVDLLNQQREHVASCVLDKSDFDSILKDWHTWRPLTCNGGVYVTLRKSGVNGTHYLHRILVNAPKELVVDHINGDTLDNRRINLRLVTRSQNSQNSDKVMPTSISGVRNCQWDKRSSRYRVRFYVGGKPQHFGWFKSLPDAEKRANEIRVQLLSHCRQNSNAPELVRLQAEGAPCKS